MCYYSAGAGAEPPLLNIPSIIVHIVEIRGGIPSYALPLKKKNWQLAFLASLWSSPKTVGVQLIQDRGE
jgi:hypothetical protein